MSDSEDKLDLPNNLSDAHRLIVEQKKRNDALEADVAELKSQVSELLERLGKSSRNSSRPPSSDSPSQRAKRRKKPPSSRRQGAQPGHARHERALLDEQAVDQVKRYLPSGTCTCGGHIECDLEPTCRHQVFDIPRVRYRVTEHQIYSGLCSACQRRHSADIPQSVPSGQMGPGLVALIAHLSGEYHLSIRQIQRFLREHWQLDFSIGAISQSQAKANRAMAAPYRAIGDHVRQQAVAHADETRHYRGTEGRWLWALVTLDACYLLTHYSRGKRAADELLGSFSGFLVTDDYVGYSRFADERHQLCWSHLIRKFVDISERVGNGGKIGRRLLLIAHAIVRTRHRFDAKRLVETVYYRRMCRLRQSLHDTLMRGSRLRIDGRTKRQCQHLLKREPLCWTFLVDHRIPLTNNTAERALRAYVIWRKLSFASQSYQGDQFRPMILSIVQTARRLRISSYDFLRTICAESMTTGTVTARLPLNVPCLPAC